MDENDLRAAMRTTMTVSQEPPAMESATALAAGRRAARRRNTLSGAGAAVALAAVALAIVPLRGTLGEPAGLQAAAPVPSPGAGGLPVPGEDETKPAWPAEASGDATYDSGTHFTKGEKLLDEILAVVPKGYTKPEVTTADGIESRYHQATFEDDGAAYLAHAWIAKGGGTGRLLAEVRGSGASMPADVCDLAKSFWGMGGTCTPATVGGEQVGVVADSPDPRLSQWAAYRHADGTVVFVAQGLKADDSVPGLAELPFSVQKLAELATDERFRLQ
ncbi:hypothetical protein FB565_003932 [Actinoplanes lutulentus]|uniref:Uncharacterized protein n=1 Tax=Actinoplanes lutulentus TaxID=1287878 RepID=A0A327ZN34_9ACTN|nr:hypothetical protein [Actinoplanes lutulentus]MBB2944203.1 hypothetical protein [Actinoplanes lutulentus]RAK42564.1 hypothetical protein B0I29_102389 [Actinoplanes lutulentus]